MFTIFQNRKKTGDAVLIWDTNAMDNSETQKEGKEEIGTKKEEVGEISFQDQLFKNLDQDSRKPEGEDIEKFLTFSKKNEEFQNLLDKEYERLKLRSKDNYIQDLSGSIKIEPISESTLFEKPTMESGDAEEKNQEKSNVDLEQVETKDSSKSHIEEMKEARVTFFDSISVENKQEGPEAETEADIEAPKDNTTTRPMDSSSEEKQDKEHDKEPDKEASPVIPVVSGQNEDKDSTENDEIDKKEKKKRGRIWKIILIIIAIILVFEIIILGILYLAPGSKAADTVRAGQTKAANFIVDTTNSIKGIFSGEDDQGQDIETNTDTDTGPLEEDTEEPQDAEVSGTAPDPKPKDDKDALVESQLLRNANIKQVKSNSSLAYNSNNDYGNADINQSKPIENNIWYTEENGKVVYLDESIVGTLIAFNSQWIDYVNEEKREVFKLIKKDSTAYKNAINFSKLGKIKETFNLMEIGEIRQGNKGYYTWIHEEIEIAEGGRVEHKTYNWIYYLEPVNNQMQIVNYYKF
jgi:hypothetical protein